MEDKSSYGDIQRRDGFSKKTSIKCIHKISLEAKDSFWVAKNLNPKWSGIFCFDGTYINVKNVFAKLAIEKKWYSEDRKFLHKMVALIGLDYHTRDLPHYSLGDNENMIDLILYFQKLKENGYQIKVLVRDSNEKISEAAIKVYGHPIVTQLCHRHFLAKMDEYIAKKDLVHQREQMIRLKNRVQFVIKSPNIDLAINRFSIFAKEQNIWRTSTAMNYLINRFIRDFEELTMYLQYPEGLVPNTSNVSENMNKQLKDRLRSMCSFQSISSAENYLKLWCLKRRFQKFTDCKKPFQHFNGKSPLQLADCNIKHLNYLKL